MGLFAWVGLYLGINSQIIDFIELWILRPERGIRAKMCRTS